MHYLLRNRLVRWEMQILEEHLPHKLTARLDYLSGKVTPAIWVSYFKTAFNGWVTKRRMRFMPDVVTLKIAHFVKQLRTLWSFSPFASFWVVLFWILG